RLTQAGRRRTSGEIHIRVGAGEGVGAHHRKSQRRGLRRLQPTQDVGALAVDEDERVLGREADDSARKSNDVLFGDFDRSETLALYFRASTPLLTVRLAGLVPLDEVWTHR